MDKIIIINLETRTDRRKACLDALETQGVPEDIIEVYHPILGNTPTEQNALVAHLMAVHRIDFKVLLDREPMRYLSVTNAHLDALQTAMALDKDELCLILEDDWGLNRKWSDLSAAMKVLDGQDTHSAFVAQLDGDWGHRMTAPFYGTLPQPITTKIGNFYKNTPVWTCHAYVVNPEAAAQMRSQMITDALKSFDCSSHFAPDVYMRRLLDGVNTWTIVPNASVFEHLDVGGSDH